MESDKSGTWLLNLYKAFSCSAFKTIVFPLKSKNDNTFLTTSFTSVMILQCVTNSKATALYHSLAIVPLTNQKSCLLVDGIQTLSWDRPSLPAGGFSPPPPAPLPSLTLSTPYPAQTWPREFKMATSLWIPVLGFFSTIQPPVCRLVSQRSWVRIPLKPWFFQASSFQLLKLENHTSLSSTAAVQIWIISYIFHKKNCLDFAISSKQVNINSPWNDTWTVTGPAGHNFCGSSTL